VVGGYRGENQKIIVVEVKKIKIHFSTSTSIYREVFLKKKNYSFSVIQKRVTKTRVTTPSEPIVSTNAAGFNPAFPVWTFYERKTIKL